MKNSVNLKDLKDAAMLHDLAERLVKEYKPDVVITAFGDMGTSSSTTVLTIRRETGSLRWTLLAILIPTAVGVFLCAAVHAVGAWLL